MVARSFLFLAAVIFAIPSHAKTDYWYMDIQRVFTTAEKPYVTFNYEGDPKGLLLEVFYQPVKSGVLSETDVRDRTPEALLRPKLRPATVGSWATASVNIPSKGPGYYVLRASLRGVVQAHSFQVTDLALVTKSSPEATLVWVLDRRKDGPAAGATVKVVARDGNRTVAMGTTDRSGWWAAPSLEGEYEIVASLGEHVARFAPYFERFGEGPTADLVYLYTDRSVYRPGDTVFYKGIAREWASGEYREISGRTAHVELRSEYNVSLQRQERITSGNGTFEGSLLLSQGLGPGTYRIVADLGDGLTGSCSFDIAEYRKPEYKVTLTPNVSPVIAGQRLQFLLEARYYFDAPLAGADVQWSGYVNADWYGWDRLLPREEWKPRWRDEDEEEEEEDSGYAWGDTRFEGTGKTGADGTLLIEVPPSALAKATDRPIVVTLSVEVLDIAGRERSKSSSAYVLPGARFAHLRPVSWVGRVGEQAKVDVLAWDAEVRHPAPDATVSVEVIRYWWERISDTWQERSELQERKQLRVDANGAGQIQFTPRQPGSYRLVATMRDLEGRVGRYETYYYVHGKGEGYWWTGSERLRIQVSARQVKVGDTLTVLFQTGSPSATVWYSIEGAKIHEHGLLRSEGGVAVLEIPIRAEMMPSLYVWGGYCREGMFQQDSVAIWIADPSRFLDLRVNPDATLQMPGDTVRYRLESLDNQGRGVAAEVSLAVVDEAIFAVRPDSTKDIRSFFYGSRSNAVLTQHSDALSFRILDNPIASMAGSRPLRRVYQKEEREADNRAKGEARIRREFRDTAFWQAAVETDENGQAVVEFRLPDNLTQWRATARAVAYATSVGQAVDKSLRVSKPLIASLELPRFASVGDEFRVITVVRNTTDTVQVAALEFEADHRLVILTRPEATITVPARGEWRFDIRVRCAESGISVLYLSAKSEKHQDAVEKRLNILEYRNLQRVTQAGTLTKRVQQVVALPANRSPGSESFELRLSPNLVALVLGSVEALAAYPYGCIEQTTSPLLADLALLEVLRASERRTPELEAKLSDMIQVGLLRLYGMQQYDGGWGWGDHSESDLYWTAYVMGALNGARRTGFQVDQDTFSRGLRRLASMVVGSQDWKPSERKPSKEAVTRYRSALLGKVIGLEVLCSVQPEAWRAALERMSRRTDELSAGSLARLAVAAKNAGAEGLAKRLVQSLMNKSRQSSDGMVWWPSSSEEHEWWNYGEQDTQVTALALEALCAVDTDPATLHGVVQWLCAARRGDMWLSTNDTAAIARGLAAYLRKTGERPFSGIVRLALDGKEVKSWQVAPGENEEIVYSAPLLSSENDRLAWELNVEGGGSIRYVATTRFNLPYATKTRAAVLSVTRSYHKLMAKAKTHRIRAYTRTAVRHSLTPTVSQVAPGDEVIVKLTVEAQRPLRHLILEDPLPAGLEPIDEDNSQYLYFDGIFGGDRYAGYGYTRREQHDNRVVLLLEDIPQGKSDYYYVVRAVTPGTFTAGPAVISAMYAAGVEGRSGGGRITVRTR